MLPKADGCGTVVSTQERNISVDSENRGRGILSVFSSCIEEAGSRGWWPEGSPHLAWAGLTQTQICKHASPSPPACAPMVRLPGQRFSVPLPARENFAQNKCSEAFLTHLHNRTESHQKALANDVTTVIEN